MCWEILDVLSIGEHGGVEGVGWSRGQGEKALELQPSEEGGVLWRVRMRGCQVHIRAAWGRAAEGQRQALDSSFPRFLVCTQKWSNGKAWLHTLAYLNIYILQKKLMNHTLAKHWLQVWPPLWSTSKDKLPTLSWRRGPGTEVHGHPPLCSWPRWVEQPGAVPGPNFWCFL